MKYGRRLARGNQPWHSSQLFVAPFQLKEHIKICIDDWFSLLSEMLDRRFQSKKELIGRKVHICTFVAVR
jgi:hypothetical protein